MDRHGLGRLGCTGCELSVALKPIFQRNNKDKKKNIRCFPHCCPGRGGHKSSGFCGSSVFASTRHACDLAVCRFESSTMEENRRILVGEAYDAAFVATASDYPVHETAAAIPGAQRFVVNPDVNKRGWSYAYDSRIEKNRRHRLSVYFMRRSPGKRDVVTCIDAVHSTWFELRSTRMPKNKPAHSYCPRQLASPQSPSFPAPAWAYPPRAVDHEYLNDGYLRPAPLTAFARAPKRPRHEESPFPPDSKWAVFTPKWTILPPLVAR
ncbi:hypothetical protein ACHHYP_03812 [Achlya hypogyna]|uniref:Uncharacterized protein n=1 Tax=Achlya hypogyna TaxID=1202772 RepID=A0A1V9Z3C6_ACHHY|nr:hypothetical protein ACHHYP_03812 [Achlya hypogyna]